MVSVGPAYFNVPVPGNDGLNINTTTGLDAYPLRTANLYDPNMCLVRIEKDGNYTCADDLTSDGWTLADEAGYYEYTKDSEDSSSIVDIRNKLKMTYASSGDVNPSNEIECHLGYQGLSQPITLSGATVTAVAASVRIDHLTAPAYDYYYGTSDGKIMGVLNGVSTQLNSVVYDGAIRNICMFSENYGMAVAQNSVPTNTIYLTRDNWSTNETVSIPNTGANSYVLSMAAPYIDDSTPAQGIWYTNDAGGGAIGIRLFRIYSATFVSSTGPIFDASNTNASLPMRYTTSDTNTQVLIMVGALGDGEMILISDAQWKKNDTDFQAINWATISGDKNTATLSGNGPTSRNITMYAGDELVDGFSVNGRTAILVGRNATFQTTLYFSIDSFASSTWTVAYNDDVGTSVDIYPVVTSVYSYISSRGRPSSIAYINIPDGSDVSIVQNSLTDSITPTATSISQTITPAITGSTDGFVTGTSVNGGLCFTGSNVFTLSSPQFYSQFFSFGGPVPNVPEFVPDVTVSSDPAVESDGIVIPFEGATSPDSLNELVFTVNGSEGVLTFDNTQDITGWELTNPSVNIASYVKTDTLNATSSETVLGSVEIASTNIIGTSVQVQTTWNGLATYTLPTANGVNDVIVSLDVTTDGSNILYAVVAVQGGGLQVYRAPISTGTWEEIYSLASVTPLSIGAVSDGYYYVIHETGGVHTLMCQLPDEADPVNVPSSAGVDTATFFNDRTIYHMSGFGDKGVIITMTANTANDRRIQRVARTTGTSFSVITQTQGSGSGSIGPPIILSGGNMIALSLNGGTDMGRVAYGSMYTETTQFTNDVAYNSMTALYSNNISSITDTIGDNVENAWVYGIRADQKAIVRVNGNYVASSSKANWADWAVNAAGQDIELIQPINSAGTQFLVFLNDGSGNLNPQIGTVNDGDLIYSDPLGNITLNGTVGLIGAPGEKALYYNKNIIGYMGGDTVLTRAVQSSGSGGGTVTPTSTQSDSFPLWAIITLSVVGGIILILALYFGITAAK